MPKALSREPEEHNPIEMKDGARRGALAVARVPAGAVPAAATPPNAPETRTAGRKKPSTTQPHAPEPRTADKKKIEGRDDADRGMLAVTRAPVGAASAEQIGNAAAPPDVSAEARVPDGAALAAIRPDASETCTTEKEEKKRRRAAKAPEAP
jgi:hypothetical protein